MTRWSNDVAVMAEMWEKKMYSEKKKEEKKISFGWVEEEDE